MTAMMTTIWKFPLEVTEVQSIDMPIGSQILCAQIQGETLCVWVKCNPDPSFPREKREIRMVGTGHIFDSQNLDYVGTIQMYGFVFHLFVGGSG